MKSSRILPSRQQVNFSTAYAIYIVLVELVNTPVGNDSKGELQFVVMNANLMKDSSLYQ